jgi:hypothetical protein
VGKTSLIISGGKLAEPSAPFSMFAEEILDEQFGLGRSSPALHLELGWIDEQGNVVGDHPTNELLGMEFDPAFVKPLKLFDQLGLRAIELGLRRVKGEVPGYPFDHVAYSGTAEGLQAALLELGFNMEVRAHLFARSEHLILSSWLNSLPNEARESFGRNSLPCSIDRVAQKMAGCDADWCDRGRYVEAAVAAILLRSIEHRLPNWVAWSPETGVVLARKWRSRTDSRRLHLVPQHLFTFNWGTTAPGYSWPQKYHLTWVPLYERYVVTVSADSPEGLSGYTDLALGSFGQAEDVENCVRAIVVGDWYGQHMEWDQAQWSDIVETGLISAETLTRWAAEVWGEEGEDEDRIEARI